MPCRHATKSKPLVMACWFKDPDDPCSACRKREEDRVARAAAHEEMLANESYYDALKRTGGSHLALWALDLYERAGKNVEAAKRLLELDSAYPEDRPYIEAHIECMPLNYQREYMDAWSERVGASEKGI